jgi:1,2-phenylacetyl-CoA epoxidase PaaB subunit
MQSYLVFARTEYAQPLEHRGNLEAADEAEAGRLATQRFGGEWLELVLVPERDIHWVHREEAETEARA